MTDKTEKPVEQEQEPTQDRRDAMKKIGKYAAYTAPAMIALLTPRTGSAGPIGSA